MCYLCDTVTQCRHCDKRTCSSWGTTCTKCNSLVCTKCFKHCKCEKCKCSTKLGCIKCAESEDTCEHCLVRVNCSVCDKNISTCDDDRRSWFSHIKCFKCKIVLCQSCRCEERGIILCINCVADDTIKLGETYKNTTELLKQITEMKKDIQKYRLAVEELKLCPGRDYLEAKERFENKDY